MPWLPDIHPVLSPLVVLFALLAFFFLKRLHELENRLAPKVSISDPVAYTEPKGTEGKADLRTFKLVVKNVSAATVKGCELKLVSMLNKDGGQSKEVGRSFKQSLEDWKPGARPYSKTFDIKPGDSVDVDLVRYKEAQGGAHVTMCYAIDVTVDRSVYTGVSLDVCPHDIIVRAVAENSSEAVERTLRFYVDRFGVLAVEPA